MVIPQITMNYVQHSIGYKYPWVNWLIKKVHCWLIVNINDAIKVVGHYYPKHGSKNKKCPPPTQVPAN